MTVGSKEHEKIIWYKDLYKESGRIWEKKATIIPINVDALGAIPSSLQKYTDCIGLQMITTAQLQKAALLETPNLRYLRDSEFLG